MTKGIRWVIERIVERFIPLIGHLFSSTVETYHALGLAEQQSQLEDEARRYEADGKPEIAAILRQRATGLPSAEPASAALRITENLTANPLLPEPRMQPENSDLPRLPESRPAKPKSRKKSSSNQHTQNNSTLPPLDPKSTQGKS